MECGALARNALGAQLPRTTPHMASRSLESRRKSRPSSHDPPLVPTMRRKRPSPKNRKRHRQIELAGMPPQLQEWKDLPLADCKDDRASPRSPMETKSSSCPGDLCLTVGNCVARKEPKLCQRPPRPERTKIQHRMALHRRGHGRAPYELQAKDPLGPITHGDITGGASTNLIASEMLGRTPGYNDQQRRAKSNHHIRALVQERRNLAKRRARSLTSPTHRLKFPQLKVPRRCCSQDWARPSSSCVLGRPGNRLKICPGKRIGGGGGAGPKYSARSTSEHTSSVQSLRLLPSCRHTPTDTSVPERPRAFWDASAVPKCV